MTRARADRSRVDFGDFQTPDSLARRVCTIVADAGSRYKSILEPTCGEGAFVVAAVAAFPETEHLLGADVHPSHVAVAQARAQSLSSKMDCRLEVADFFATDWRTVVESLPEPVLVIGNPPWVTNSHLAVLGSQNLPKKQNKDGRRGIDAMTGHSNFDISESMLRTLLDAIAGRHATLAVLCKTSVARKVLRHAWRTGVPITSASLHRIDAIREFGASVDACLLLIHVGDGTRAAECPVFDSLSERLPSSTFGLRGENLVADLQLHDRWAALGGQGLSGWRSGVKHDCSAILELTRNSSGTFVNSAGDLVDLEPEVAFPFAKSSDLAASRKPTRWLLVTQRTMAENPERLKRVAPTAWAYLLSHGERLDARRSSIYRGRPRFSIFGVGDYSFSPWKLAVSGLYKRLSFTVLQPFEGQPVLCDDTCYIFACQTEDECRDLLNLFESQPAQEFLTSQVFWDAKRPITARLLNSLSISALADALDCKGETVRRLAERQFGGYHELSHQAMLFTESQAS